MTRRLLGALALVAALAIPAAAHKGHASPSPSPAAAATAAPGTDVEAVSAQVEEASPAPADEATLVAEPEPENPEELPALQVIPWQSALTSHLHNKIVHFPLAFGLAAAVLFIVGPRWPAYQPAARLLLIVAAAAAVAAYFSGRAQESVFDDSPFHSVVELHETLGITSALTLFAGVALSFQERARRYMPLYGVLLVLVLAATGFLGGVLSHS
jgi:uncharacterized membrane protein